MLYHHNSDVNLHSLFHIQILLLLGVLLLHFQLTSMDKVLLLQVKVMVGLRGEQKQQ